MHIRGLQRVAVVDEGVRLRNWSQSNVRRIIDCD